MYFTALDAISGQPAVFSARPAASQINKISNGGLISPLSIAINSGDTTLFVADPGSELTTSAADVEYNHGGVVTVDATSGAVTMLIKGYQPTAVTVGMVNNTEKLFFGGRNTATGLAGVYSADLSGGNVTTILEGAPFTEVGAIAQDAAGDLKVINHDNLGGTVYTISGGAATAVESGGYVAYPGSFAYSLDGLTRVTAKFVAGHDQIVLKTGTTATAAAANVAAYNEATGIRRASGANIFSFVDSSANGSGTVFLVSP